MEVSFDLLRRKGAFTELGRLYPNPVAAQNLIEDLGVKSSRVITFTPPLTAEQFWREFCRDVEHGKFEFGLDELVDEVGRQHPGNTMLRELRRYTPLVGELRVLCLQASPTDAARLRLDVEHRVIAELASRSKRPMRIIVHPATRTSDIVSKLIDVQPTVVHFAGHAEQGGLLLFEADSGLSAPVSIETIAGILANLEGLECVVMTSCYSAADADVLLRSTPVVVGAEVALRDDCAVAFSRGFYTALGAGRALKESFGWGCGEMSAAGCDTHHMRFVEREQQAS